MAMACVVHNIIADEDEAAVIAGFRINRLRLRDQQNPFELPEIYFRNLFRISKDMAMDLSNNLRNILHPRRSTGLSVECQILCAVRFYAVGSYQRAVGQDFMIAISQTAVSRCVRKVTTAINDQLLRQWIKFPATQQQRVEARREFAQAPQPFPGAIGAIDCTHVAIVAPNEHEEAFVNHHGFHSLNVQMVCGPNLKILNVNARFPGSRHDAAIWVQSPVRTLMQVCYDAGERDTWLIGEGDSGYPLEPWLMAPIVHAAPGTREYSYTQAHCQARCIVERCFGMLKMVWRCLSQQRILMYDPAMAGKIINACSTLHNMRMHYGVIMDNEVQDPAPPLNVPHEAEQLQARERLAEARRIRQELIRRHY